MNAIDILKEKLVGNFYSRISLGDTFDLCFDGFWLIAHNVVSNDEEQLNEQFIERYSSAAEAIDREDVAKSVVLCCTRRKKIVDVVLAPDSTLELIFENGISLSFPTSTETVDWQWAITVNGQEPHNGYLISVFESGEVQVGSC